MDPSEFERKKADFTAYVTNRVRSEVRSKVVEVFGRVLAEGDVLIAAGLGVDVKKILRDEIIHQVNELLNKEE